MIFTQHSKDEKNKISRTKNLIDIIKKNKYISLILEPSLTCNLKCKFCDIHSGRLDKISKDNKGIMSLNLYRNILNEIEKLDFKFENIYFHGNGEPLLNKNIIEMISIAKERKIANRLSIITNGTLMNPEFFDKLLLSGIDEIVVSLDTIDKKLYEKIKGKDLLNDVINNINYGISQLYNFHHTTLVIKACTNGDIYGISDENIKNIIDKYKNVVEHSKNIHIKNIPIVQYVDGLIKKEKECHSTCEMPFYTVYIRYDGRISTCCADTINVLTIGKIGNRESLKDILLGNKIRDIKRIHLSGNLDNIQICKYCTNRTVVDLSQEKNELLKFI